MRFSIQNSLILLGPALFAASIYMTLSRIIRCVRGEKYSIVRINWLTKIFVLGDVLSFVVQGSGAGIMVTGNHLKTGEVIIVLGLMIQIISFGLFAVTAIIFQVRIQRYPTHEAVMEEQPWRQSLHMLYGVSALIMVRSIFRVVEFALGNDGYPLSHEWTLYIFDSLLMFIVMVVFFIWYPSKIRPRPVDDAGVQLNGQDGKFR
ncbi:hypothetical protein VTN77DRAFT_4505 [Rasamsonia byssochlamydoides]|uniref:uncharacterized protein n=1 Tax=Rasamsonia byssochlamydoides TaxID=89139 RepID=UPI0037437DC3